MSIQFECPNAHTLYANESQVGRALACRTCGETAIVPSRSLGTIEVVSPPRTGNRNKGPNRTLIVILSCLVPLALAVLLSGAFLIYWLSKPTADSDLTVTDDPSTKNSLAQPATNTVNTQEVSKKLRAIGIAWFNFESQNKRFVPVGATRLSWRVHLLPYLEQGPLYEQFKLDEPWDSPHNVALVEAMPDVFRISDTTEKGKTRIQTPTGPNLFFGNETIPKFSTMTDGNQNTLLAVVVGEDKATPWTKPDELRIKPEAAIESLGKLTESFIFGISGSAEPVVLSADMSPFDFYATLTPRGGEAVDLSQLANRSKQTDQKKSPVQNIAESNKARSEKIMQIGAGIQNFESAFKMFPIAMNPTYFDENNRPKLSWRVHLLPFINQRPLYEKFNLEEPWDSPHNLQLLQKMPEIYRDPADPDRATKTRIVRLTGPNTPFKEFGPGPRMREFTDGAMSTLMLISCGADKAIPWTKPDDLPFDENASVACLGNIDGPVILGAFTDNRSAQFDVRIPPEVFKCYVTHQGMEVIASNPYLLSDF